MASSGGISTIYQRPAEILQRLIRFDTTNPPGNEAECIAFIDELLNGAGIKTTIFARASERPNLIARLSGRGNAPAMLLYGHVDVVTTEHQKWQYPPFEGKIADGFIWGRGALDMKGGIAMMLAAFLRAKVEGLALPGDVVLAIVSDEEGLGGFGSRFLVENHPDLFEGIRYAIGEFGGFSLYVNGQKFYPISVAEKQVCWIRATVRGPAGHGSLPARGGAVAKLAGLLQKLDKKRLPVHITPTARLMFKTMASALGRVNGLIVRQLLNPSLTNIVLNVLGQRGHVFDPLLRNTVNATVLHGSDKTNVVPGEVSVDLDGRLLPGFKPDDMIAELRRIIGREAELEVLHFDPGPSDPDMGLFDKLTGILRELDPEGKAVPLLLAGTSDARFFTRLGIQTYGFLPMPLPKDFNFAKTIHAADERIPISAVDFGTNAIYELLKRFE
jgi:acetylornithine deacetylase/succinyl-diaminopimelate desuccinylase-like protein